VSLFDPDLKRCLGAHSERLVILRARCPYCDHETLATCPYCDFPMHWVIPLNLQGFRILCPVDGEPTVNRFEGMPCPQCGQDYCWATFGTLRPAPTMLKALPAVIKDHHARREHAR
jgi:hypothetical protein